MTNKIALLLEVIGLITLIYGYVKRNRNILLLAAILLWLGAGLGDFVRGFIAGGQGHQGVY